MKVTVLGCGTSGGVPTITGDWGVCDPDQPKNRRTRQSVCLHYNDKNVLIDTSPDLRAQLLRERIQSVDAVLYTHAHADHCHGIDDLRDIYFKRDKKRIPVYTCGQTLKELYQKFPYLFSQTYDPASLYPALFDEYVIEGEFDLFGKKVLPFKQNHGSIKTLGFRIEQFAYSTDVVELDAQAFEALRGVEVWLVDCLQLHPHLTHAWLARTLEWIDIVQPRYAYLIHMNKNIDYQVIQKKLPDHVRPAYDGLVLDL